MFSTLFENLHRNELLVRNGKLNSNLQVKSTHLTHFNEKIIVTVKGENSIVLLRDLIGINFNKFSYKKII